MILVIRNAEPSRYQLRFRSCPHLISPNPSALLRSRGCFSTELLADLVESASALLEPAWVDFDKRSKRNEESGEPAHGNETVHVPAFAELDHSPPPRRKNAPRMRTKPLVAWGW